MGKKQKTHLAAAMSCNSVTLKYPDGEPLLASDLVEGSRVEFDPFTGIVSRIRNPVSGEGSSDKQT